MIAAGLLLLAVLSLAHQLGQKALARRQHEVEAELRREVALRVEVHAQLVHRLLDHADTIHALATDAFGAMGKPPEEIGSFVRLQLEALGQRGRSGFFQVAVIGENGELQWATTPVAGPVALHDREHFRVHADGLRGPFISAPMIGRASGRPTIQLTRPVLGPDGQFRGVSVVSVDPELVSSDLALAPMQENGRVLLVRTDGLILASGDMTDGWAGQQVGGANLRRILANPNSVEFLQGSRTGRTRIAAWRQIGEWPAFVVHSLPREIAAVEARRRAFHERVTIFSALAAFWCFAVAAAMTVHAMLSRQAARYADRARRQTDRTLAALPGAAYRLDLGAEGDIDWRPIAPALAAALGEQPAGRTEGCAPWDDVLDREARAIRAEFTQRLQQEGEAIAEYNAVTSGGELRRLREHARLFTDDTTQARQVAGLLTDVTAQRELEARLATAARMSRLGDMASGIAHEVNQPATAIALGVDIALLQLEQLDPRQAVPLRDSLEQVAQQAIRLRDVIAHFRAFSRPDAEHGPLRFERLDAAIEGVRRIVDGMLQAAGVTLRISLPSDLPRISCRLIPLEQVLLNLIVNARDAMLGQPEASRRIELSAALDDGGEVVKVTVRDHGPGFPSDVLPHVFEPFFTTKGPDHGTGLGLSIVHATMRGFQGDVAVRNHPLGGAEVTLTFPHTAASDRQAPALSQKES